MPITVMFRDIGVPDTARVRDLWARKDLGLFRQSFSSTVNGHGMVMIRVWGSLEGTPAAGG